MQWTGAAEKVRIYVNTAKKTMQQIKSETGCDIIINGGLYSMGTYKPVCHLKVDGKVLAKDQYAYFGYGWNDGADLKLISDYTNFRNYICCVCMVKDGKRQTMYCDPGVKGARARTAVGTMPNGYLWVYITSNPQTPEALQETAMLYGVKDAVMLDGGASTQGVLPSGTITSARNVHNYLCVWTKKKGTAAMPNIKTRLANPANYGAARSLNSIRYLVIHATGNDGDSDESNGNYFANNKVQTSAHYFVDDDSITQSVPDDCIAWHCGAKVYYHADARNFNSIGIELCDSNRDGQIYPTQKTIDRALELTRWLMMRYNIPADRVIRHYDVSHKLCPIYWCGTAVKNTMWLSAFWNRLSEKPAEKPQESAGTTEGVVSVNVPVLKRGSTGATVIALQTLLKGYGYDPNGIDGSFGPGCESAVRRYQSNMGLAVDGSVGQATWNKLMGVK